jgi:MYXO-CTERM domain-containing protein
MNRQIVCATTILWLVGLTQTAQANTAWDGVHVEPGQDNGVISLSATDGNTAWALAVRNDGQSGEIVGLRTDNGESWQQLMLPPSTNPMFPSFFSSLVLVDGQTGYVAGMDMPTNKIWRTTNGGGTWTEVLITDGLVTQFQALPTGDDFAVAADTVVHSTDGVTWTSATVPSPGGEVIPQGIFMLNPTCGWLVGGWAYDEDNHPTPSDGAVWSTIDGGQTWTLLAQGLPYYLSRVYFVAGDLGFAVGSAGDRGVLVRTTDGGQTWTEQALPIHPAMPDVCMGFGICIDDPAEISDMKDVRFFDAQRGVALGLACTSPPCDRGDSAATYLTSFLRTYDGGQTWTHDAQYEDAMPDIDLGFMTLPGQLAKQITLSFPDPNHGFLGGQHNMILRYEATDPEPMGEVTMPACDSNANTNGSTNSNGYWPNDPDNTSGCGCNTNPASAPALGLALLAVLLMLIRRRP